MTVMLGTNVPGDGISRAIVGTTDVTNPVTCHGVTGAMDVIPGSTLVARLRHIRSSDR